MGGPGSGPRWWRGNKKSTVESCLYTLPISALSEALAGHTGRVGTLQGTRGEEVLYSMGISTESTPDGLAVRLQYSKAIGEESRVLDYLVHVEKVRPHFGGVRWYFLCPLVHEGRPCLHRGEKLYLPPGGLYFGCRKCYDLTYTTSQESHKFDGMYKSLAAEMGRGVTPQQVKYLLWRKERIL